jgi:hypothetical protein
MVHINATGLCGLQMVSYVYQLGLPYFTNNYHTDHIKETKWGGICSTYGENRNVQQNVFWEKRNEGFHWELRDATDDIIKVDVVVVFIRL